MKRSDYFCNACKSTFEIFVNNNLDDFPVNPVCEVCGSIQTERRYTNIVFDIAEGKLGNSKNKYDNGFVDHPSSLMGKVKGKRIK